MTDSQPPQSLPTYLYKILSTPPPSPLPTALPTTDLDAQDNFIHLSRGWRIAETAGLFFAAEPTLWLLQLRATALDGETRYPADLPGCAHVHGSAHGLGAGNVVKVLKVNREEGQSWGEVQALRELEE